MTDYLVYGITEPRRAERRFDLCDHRSRSDTGQSLVMIMGHDSLPCAQRIGYMEDIRYVE